MVETELMLSPIQGVGLFAAQVIQAGTVVWQYDNELSFAIYSEQEWEQLKRNLSRTSYTQLRRYAYKHKQGGKIYLNLDDTRFINHSISPNIQTDAQHTDTAKRDIKAGEELVIDYTTFYEQQWFEETMKL